MNELIATPLVYIVWGLVIILLIASWLSHTHRDLLLVLAVVLSVPAPFLTQSLHANRVESSPTPVKTSTQATIGANDSDNPKPKYPNVARTQGWQGNVILKVLVSAKGNSEQVTVLQSSGHDLLDQAAVDAVKQWRFVPAKRGGTAIASTENVPINFKLDN
jgi:protein TonB